jgi:hypothetical protein
MEIAFNQKEIENRIFTVRGVQVMIDRHLAELYQVETRVLNQAVKRNQDRFPTEFSFQLNEEEFSNWKSQIVISNQEKMGLRKPPYAFTEQGVAMLSAVLRSETAIKVSIQIMKAKTNIILIDNYIDESVLMTLAKRDKDVSASVYTRHINPQLQLDLKKHNLQYPTIEIKTITDTHDRFLLLDNEELYHIGASLKDLGKKWFAFSRMDDFATEILNRIHKNDE